MLSSLRGGAYERTLAANRKEWRCAGFLSRYLSGPLSYVRRHITVNKLFSVHHIIKHLGYNMMITTASVTLFD